MRRCGWRASMRAAKRNGLGMYPTDVLEETREAGPGPLFARRIADEAAGADAVKRARSSFRYGGGRRRWAMVQCMYRLWVGSAFRLNGAGWLGVRLLSAAGGPL